MELLVQACDRMASQFGKLRPQAWGLSLLLVVALAGGLLWVRRPAPEAYSSLFPDQTCAVHDLAKMLVAFRKAGLPEARVSNGQLLVPPQQRDAYLAALETAHALPADFDEALDRLVSNPNPFASAQQNELLVRWACQKKLGRIIAGMHGIESASVQYDEVKMPGFPPTVEKRAFVAVRAVASQPLLGDQIEAIRDTVAGYIGGLERSDVTVTDLSAGRAYPGHGERSAAHLNGPALAAANRALEKELGQKIQQRLEKYPDVVVAVSVHPCPEAGPSSEKVAGSQTPSAAPPAFVTASIDVPQSYFRKVWRERQSGPASALPDGRQLQQIEAEVTQAIERAVAALLPPPPADQAARPQVTVTSYADLPPADSTARRTAVAAGPWLTRNWPVLGLGGVFFIGLLAWRGRSESQPGTALRQLADSGPSGRDYIADSSDAPGSLPAGDLTLLNSPRHRELQRVIQQDPTAAAQMLSQWMDEGHV